MKITAYGKKLGEWLYDECGHTIYDFNHCLSINKAHLGFEILRSYRAYKDLVNAEESGALIPIFHTLLEGMGSYLGDSYQEVLGNEDLVNAQERLESIGSMVVKALPLYTITSMNIAYDKACDEYVESLDVDSYDGEKARAEAVAS